MARWQGPNYVGHLMELLQQKKIHLSKERMDNLFRDKIDPNYSFVIAASFSYEERLFESIGTSTSDKRTAKHLAAKNVLIKFLKYLQQDNPCISIAKFQLTEDDFKNDENIKLNSSTPELKNNCNYSDSKDNQHKSNSFNVSSTVKDRDNVSITSSKTNYSKQQLFNSNGSFQYPNTVKSKITDHKEKTIYSNAQSPYAKGPENKNDSNKNFQTRRMAKESKSTDDEDNGKILNLNNFTTKKHKNDNDENQRKSIGKMTDEISSIKLLNNSYLYENSSSPLCDSSVWRYLNDAKNRKIIRNVLKANDNNLEMSKNTDDKYTELITKICKQLPELQKNFFIFEDQNNSKVVCCAKFYFQNSCLYTFFTEVDSYQQVVEGINYSARKLFYTLRLQFSDQ